MERPIDVNSSYSETKTNEHTMFEKVASFKNWYKRNVNIDMWDLLSNDKTGNISHIEFVQLSVCKVYVKFSEEKTVLKAMRSYHLGRQNSWVPN